MDIDAVIRRVINDNDPHLTSGAATLGTLIADALADAGLTQLDGDQVADYIRDLGDRTQMTSGDVAAALAEVIEEDLEEEDGE